MSEEVKYELRRLLSVEIKTPNPYACQWRNIDNPNLTLSNPEVEEIIRRVEYVLTGGTLDEINL